MSVERRFVVRAPALGDERVAVSPRPQPRYSGPVRAVILDWAGTTIDFGSIAPVSAFQRVFAARDVDVTVQEARASMGLEKRAHLEAIASAPAVANRWREVHGIECTAADIDALYTALISMQRASLLEHADLVPGTRETVAELRARGILIGSTSGYSSEILEALRLETAARGYVPDSVVSSTDVPAGRPAPFMCFKSMTELGVWPVQSCVKVDDTPVGILEGLTAGMWTVGVTLSGNEVGLSLEDLEALDHAEVEAHRAAASRRLFEAGAHYVIDTIASLSSCIDLIERKLAEGEHP